MIVLRGELIVIFDETNVLNYLLYYNTYCEYYNNNHIINKKS